MIKSPCEVAFHRTPFLSTFFSFCFEYLFVIDFEQFDYDMFCVVFFFFFFCAWVNWGPWICRFTIFIKLQKLGYQFFQIYFLSPYSSFWFQAYLVSLLEAVSHHTNALFILLLLLLSFSLCFLFWILRIGLSVSSIIFFNTLFTLLSNPFSIF